LGLHVLLLHVALEGHDPGLCLRHGAAAQRLPVRDGEYQAARRGAGPVHRARTDHPLFRGAHRCVVAGARRAGSEVGAALCGWSRSVARTMSDPERSTPRVLVVLGNYALNGQERGNIEVFRAVKARGVDALFATHADWGHVHLQPALDRLGLRWTTLPYARHFTKRTTTTGWLRNLGQVMRGARAFQRIARTYRPTPIHVANPHYFLSVLPALLLTRTPVVYRLGDAPTEHHAFYRILWRRFVIPRVSAFVCVSEYVRERLLATGCPPEKARVIYSHPPARPDGAAALDLGSFVGRTVLYVGQVAPHKGVDLLVEAAISLCEERDDVRFLLAGLVVRQNTFALGLIGKVQAAG